MAACPTWSPKLGDLPQLRKIVKAERVYTDEEVAWWSARVKFYLRKNADMTKAMDRAAADLRDR
jgi:hypothetical protein